MFRLLFILLLLTAGLHAAEAPPPPPTDFLEYPAGPLAVLFVVAVLMTIVMVPVCLIVWAIFVFGLVMICKMCGIPPTALLMKLVQRQMMGRNKGLVWQLAILICLPAGIAGLWLATKIFGLPSHGSSLLTMGIPCGVVVAVGFIAFAKVLLRGMKQRMMGRMGGAMGGMNPMQAQMMAEMMKMKNRKLK